MVGGGGQVDGLSGTPVYIRLCQFTSEGRDVELDNRKCTRQDDLYL